MSNDEALDVTKIYSFAGTLVEQRGMIDARPFRAPHHTISMDRAVRRCDTAAG